VGVRQLLLLVVGLMSIVHGSAALKVGFYNTICPKAEATVKAVVQSRFTSDTTITPALLRLFFHDCFVRVSLL
jgi:peroxidase